MHPIFYFLVIFVLYLLIWTIICFIGYLISLVLQKAAVMKTIYGLSVVVMNILYFIVGIYYLYVAWGLFFSNFLHFVLFVVIGGYLIVIAMSLMTTPFMLISGYFTELLDEKLSKESNYKTSKKDKKNDKDTITLSVLLLMSYFITLIYNVTVGSINESYSWGGHIIGPALAIGVFIIIGLLMGGLYNMVRHEKFYPKGKKRTVINTLKVYVVITTIIFVFAILNLILAGAVGS